MGGIYIEAYFIDMEDLTRVEIEEALLYEIAALNMPLTNYNVEVIKAIAVLKRSQLVKEIKNSRYAAPSRDNIILDRSFYDSFDEISRGLIQEVVTATKGIVAVSGSKAVDIFITECCGGGTSNSEDVLGYRINYLRRVLCKYCSGVNFNKRINIGEYAKELNLKGLSFRENIESVFDEVERDETGRIISVSFLDTKMTGEELAKLFSMESNRIYFMEDSVVLKSIGKGIGLGICLEGANCMAESGRSFMEIIEYYYTGVVFENLDEYKLLKTLRDKKIIIDPGHGGMDRGNTNLGLEEKDINLKISLELGERLKSKEAEVIFTRREDLNIPLSDRVNIINKERPELYISVHQNSFASPGVNGVECYCYNRDEEALKLGNIISREISSRVGVKNRGTRTGNYFLLRECKVSGVMVECMYLSGSQDIGKYNEANYINIAEAIYESICIYYDIEP